MSIEGSRKRERVGEGMRFLFGGGGGGEGRVGVHWVVVFFFFGAVLRGPQP